MEELVLYGVQLSFVIIVLVEELQRAMAFGGGVYEQGASLLSFTPTA
jgi:hypothetical protein